MSTDERPATSAAKTTPDPPDNVILRNDAWRKMWREDNNALWTVVGDTGDGKSMASLRIAEVLDPDFTIDQVAFDIIEFLELVMDDELGQGSVIILEEASVEASALDWHSESNRVFAKVLDTWRHQNRMGIINLPNFNALEKGARRRTKAIVEMQYAVPWKDYSQAKYKRVDYNNISDNMTTPFPTIDGRKRKYLRFKMPSDHLVEAYEEKKQAYTANLNEDLLNDLLSSQKEEEQRRRTPEDIVDDIIEDDRVGEFIGDNYGQKYVDRDLLKVEYDLGEGTSKTVKKLLMKEADIDAV
jgi:hypothetical protein